MNTRMAFFLILLVFASPAEAEETKSAGVSTPEWSYELKAPQFIPGHTVKNIVKGYHPGDFTANPGATQLDTEVLSELFPRATAQKKEQNNVSMKEAKRIEDQFRSYDPNSGAGRNGSKEPSPIDALPEGAFGLYWDAFMQCALDTLPTIKDIIRLEKSTETNPIEKVKRDVLAKNLLRLINGDRGNGTEIAPNGVACGRFLGNAGFIVTNLKDDVKFLAAAIARNGEEAKTLIRAASAASRNGIDPASTRLWTFYWKRLSMLAVFGKDALPEFSQLEEEYRAGLERVPVSLQSKLLEVKFLPLGLSQMTHEGIEYGRKVLP